MAGHRQTCHNCQDTVVLLTLASNPLMLCQKENRRSLSTFLPSLLSGPVYMVLQLDSNLPLVGLIPYERVLEQLLRRGPLHVVLHQAALYEAEELL